MKKTYVKPTINLESFVLTQSIAHDCGDNLTFSYATLKYKGSCGWDLTGLGDPNSGMVLFMNDQSVCSLPTASIEGVCYNNPQGGYNVFNS